MADRDTYKYERELTKEEDLIVQGLELSDRFENSHVWFADYKKRTMNYLESIGYYHSFSRDGKHIGIFETPVNKTDKEKIAKIDFFMLNELYPVVSTSREDLIDALEDIYGCDDRDLLIDFVLNLNSKDMEEIAGNMSICMSKEVDIAEIVRDIMQQDFEEQVPDNIKNFGE